MPITIFIDADAAPRDVMATVERCAAAVEGAEVVTLSTVNHHFDTPNHITVDAHPQAVDMEIVGRVQRGVPTIVVTQDYGLAALVLGKGAAAVSVHGLEYTNDNIDRLLFERDLNAKARRATGRNRGPKPRSRADAALFEETFRRVLLRFARQD